MGSTADLLTQIFATGVFAAHIGLVLLVLHQLTPLPFFPKLVAFLRQYGLLLGFLVAFGAVVTSLYYSEVVGLVPCKLCWLQRIFIYPSAVILFIAWWRNDRDVWRYVVPLSVIGSFFALWHYALQKTGSSLLSCGSDAAASCSKMYFNEFGYITFPMMGLTTLVLIGVLAYLAKK